LPRFSNRSTGPRRDPKAKPDQRLNPSSPRFSHTEAERNATRTRDPTKGPTLVAAAFHPSPLPPFDVVVAALIDVVVAFRRRRRPRPFTAP